MLVFLSWSKRASRRAAEGLADWLPGLLDGVEPWLSSNIDAGARWSPEIASKLANTKFGIIFVTNENQSEPWLNFEAGACGKTIENTFVCPYLVDLAAADVRPGPLVQFQMKAADRHGTLDLVQSLNNALARSGAHAIKDEILQKRFEKLWPDLEALLTECRSIESPPPARSREDVLTEILTIVRRNEQHQMRASETLRDFFDGHRVDVRETDSRWGPSRSGVVPVDEHQVPDTGFSEIKVSHDRSLALVSFRSGGREFTAAFTRQEDGTVSEPRLMSNTLAKHPSKERLEAAAKQAALEFRIENEAQLLEALGHAPAVP